MRGHNESILLDEVEIEQNVELGPQLVAMKAWDALGFTSMLDNLGLSPAAIATAQLMVATKTLQRFLARLALPEAGLKPVVILDAGFASAANLALLRELGYS